MINNLNLNKNTAHADNLEKAAEGKNKTQKGNAFGKILEDISKSEPARKSILLNNFLSEKEEIQPEGTHSIETNIMGLIKHPSNIAGEAKSIILKGKEVSSITFNGKELQFIGKVEERQMGDKAVRGIVNATIEQGLNLKKISVKTILEKGEPSSTSSGEIPAPETKTSRKIKTAELFGLHFKHSNKSDSVQKPAQIDSGNNLEDAEKPMSQEEIEVKLGEESGRSRTEKEKKPLSVFAKKYLRESSKESEAKADGAVARREPKIKAADKKTQKTEHKQPEINEDRPGSKTETKKDSIEIPQHGHLKNSRKSVSTERIGTTDVNIILEDGFAKDEKISFKLKDLENRQAFAAKLTAEIANKVGTTHVIPGKMTEIKLTIEPKSLGRIDITLNSTKDNLDLSIKVSNKGVENVLTENIFSLKEKIEKNTSLNMNNINIYTENTKGTENNLSYRRVEEQYQQNQGNGQEGGSQGQEGGRNPSNPEQTERKEGDIDFRELQEEFLRGSTK